MKTLSLSFLLFGMAFTAFPQIPSSISGRVVDSGGLPLPGTEVMLEQSGTELSKSFITDMEGMYHFDCLMEGIYSLTFRLKGFITERMENFEYHSLYPLKLNRQLAFNPAIYGSDGGIPSNEPLKPLMIFIKDNRSSSDLENAQVVVSGMEGILPKTSHSNLCGYTYLFLDPGKRYSARISKDGFQEQIIDFDMPDAAKKLEIRLNRIKQ